MKQNIYLIELEKLNKNLDRQLNPTKKQKLNDCLIILLLILCFFFIVYIIIYFLGISYLALTFSILSILIKFL